MLSLSTQLFRTRTRTLSGSPSFPESQDRTESKFRLSFVILPSLIDASCAPVVEIHRVPPSQMFLDMHPTNMPHTTPMPERSWRTNLNFFPKSPQLGSECVESQHGRSGRSLGIPPFASLAPCTFDALHSTEKATARRLALVGWGSSAVGR